MRLVILSDTHKWALTNVPDGDVLIHCGDFTSRFCEDEDGRYRRTSESDHVMQVEAFNCQLKKLPHPNKVVVAGNNDLPFRRLDAQSLITSAIYLRDELVEIGGFRIYGSPWIPGRRRGAFCLSRNSAELTRARSKIPDGLDVLITHAPPHGILDRNVHGYCEGDELLLKRVLAVRPKLHCFGHVHYSRGKLEREGIIFINAAMLDDFYQPANPPVVIDI